MWRLSTPWCPWSFRIFWTNSTWVAPPRLWGCCFGCETRGAQPWHIVPRWLVQLARSHASNVPRFNCGKILKSFGISFFFWAHCFFFGWKPWGRGYQATKWEIWKPWGRGSLRKDGSLVVAGPPCSLFIWISSGTHKRKKLGINGDIKLLSVRMANSIARNFVARSIDQWR